MIFPAKNFSFPSGGFRATKSVPSCYQVAANNIRLPTCVTDDCSLKTVNILPTSRLEIFSEHLQQIIFGNGFADEIIATIAKGQINI